MWTTLTGTLEKMHHHHHHHHQYHHRHPSSLQAPSSCGPSFRLASIPRRQRRVLRAMLAAQVVAFVVIGLSLRAAKSRGGLGRISHPRFGLFFLESAEARVVAPSASEEDRVDADAVTAAATELLTVDALPDAVPPRRRRLLEQRTATGNANFPASSARRRIPAEEEDKIFAPLEEGDDDGGDDDENENKDGGATTTDDKNNESGTNKNDNSNQAKTTTNNNDALSLSLQLSMWTDEREEHSLLIRLAVQRAILDILCQSNEVVVLSVPATSDDKMAADAATNVCLTGEYTRRHLLLSDVQSEQQEQLQERHRALAWEDASANGYYTVLDSDPVVRLQDERVSYIPFQAWSVNYPVLNMGALYKNQVSTNQQYLESSGESSNSTNPSDSSTASDDVVASDGAIQLAAMEIFAGEIQRKLDRLLASGSVDATIRRYALNATAYTSVVGSEYETFSQVVPAPLNPVTAFFTKTFDEWTWDPIHVACVVLLGSLVVGMAVLVCLLCRRRALKVVYSNRAAANSNSERGAPDGKNYHSGSSTGNDETLSVGFPDVLALGPGSLRRSHESEDESVHSLYAPSIPAEPQDTTASLAHSDSRMEEGLPPAEIFDPAVYAYLDAEQHYAQASAVDEGDLKGGWGSCLIPLPGSLRKAKSGAEAASSPPSPKRVSAKAQTAVVEGGAGILRPPSYTTSGPVDVDEARNNQAALEECDDDEKDNKDKDEEEEDRHGWSSSSRCTSEGVTLAYETDLDATVEIDADTGYYLNKRLKRVAFKYVETNRSMSPDKCALGGERDVDYDDGLISDLDDEASFSALYGGPATIGEPSPRVFRRRPTTGTEATETDHLKTEGPSVPVDIDSLLTADQVGMMPTEIGTCATLGLSTEADKKASAAAGGGESVADAVNVTAPRLALGQSVRKAASMLGLKSLGSGAVQS